MNKCILEFLFQYHEIEEKTTELEREKAASIAKFDIEKQLKDALNANVITELKANNQLFIDELVI